MKKAIMSISGVLGIHRLYASLNRRRPIVLTFHGVTAEPPGHICNDEGLHLHLPVFARLMRHLARYYSVVPLSRVVDWLEGRGELPDRAVVITFDDGYRDVLLNAAPLLHEFGLSATLFVVTDFVFDGRMLWPDRLLGALAMTDCRELRLTTDGVDRTYPLIDRRDRLRANAEIVAWCKSIPESDRMRHVGQIVGQLGVDEDSVRRAWEGFRPLDPDEMAQLPALGVEIGSHTCSHPIVTQLSADAMHREMVESRRRIEAHLGRPCEAFAYPNGGPGDFNESSRRAALGAGYRCALTTIKRRTLPGTDVFEIPRCAFTYNGMSVSEFAVQVSGMPEALRGAKSRLVGPGRTYDRSSQGRMP